MYEEMHRFLLNELKYSEPYNNSVLLILENNILARGLRRTDRVIEILNNGKDISSDGRVILFSLAKSNKINLKEASKLLNRSTKYSRNVLRKLREMGYIEWSGTSQSDPTQYYFVK